MENVSPFENDIFSLIWKAYCVEFPDNIPVNLRCYWVNEIRDDGGAEVFGSTTFGDDGAIEICVSGNIKVLDAAEVFAHELAHLVAGVNAKHGDEWEDAFERIYRKYFELAGAE